jgi:predicted ArsR family transcriptional regulator
VYSSTPRSDAALAHPIRAALFDLVRERGTLTSTQAAALLGHSSGLCSFHLRQLARYGYVEEAEHGRGRTRPWRLASAPQPPADDGEFSRLARDLEDEGYQRWLARKHEVAQPWQRDAAFSMVLRLTPAELTEVAEEIQAVLERHAGATGTGQPVGAVVRLFPLLPAQSA